MWDIRSAAMAVLACALATGCTGKSSEPTGDAAHAVVRENLVFTATTAVLESYPVQLQTRMTVRNRGTTSAVLLLPSGCDVMLRATPVAVAQRRWDQQGVTMCTQALQTIEIPASGKHEFVSSTDAREILGDSLPDGKYQLAAYVRSNGGEVEVQTGVVPLSLPR